MIKLNPPPAASDDFADVPEAFRPVAQAHGRALYEFVMNVQLGGEAAERIAPAVQGARAVALHMLVRSFNAIGNAYAQAQGWGQEDLLACKQALEVAFAACPAEAEPPKIILNS